MAETVTFLVMGLPSEKLVRIIEYYIDWWPKKRYKLFLDLFKAELKNVEKKTRKIILDRLNEDVLSEVFSLAVNIFPIQDAFLPSGEVDFFLLERSVPETLTHAILDVLSLYGEVDDLKGLREAFRISIKKFKEKLFSSLSSLGVPEIMEELVNIDPENYVIFTASFERKQAGGARVKELGAQKEEVLEFTPSVVKSESEIKKVLKWPSMERIPGIGESNQIKYGNVSNITEFPCFFEEMESYGLRAANLKTALCKTLLPLNPNIIEVLEDVDFRENLLEIEKMYLDQLIGQMAFDPDLFRFITRGDKLRLIIFLEHLKRDIIDPLSTEKKNELLNIIAVIEGRIIPSEYALKELSAMKPVMNRSLQFEFYLQLGYNLLLRGDLIKSEEIIKEAHSYAEETDQIVFLQILEALIKVRKNQYEAAIEELNDCLEKTNFPKLKGVISYNTGMAYYIQGYFEDAFRSFEDAQSWLQIEQDIAAIHGKRGVCALKLKMYEEAFQEFKKLESLAEKNDHRESLAAAYEALGTIYSITEKFDEAAKYYGMALEIDQELNNDKAISNDYSNIGTIYYKKERLDDAMKYYERALQIHQRMNEKRKVAIEYNNIGVTLKAKGNLGKALQYFEEALKINEELENVQAVATNCNNIASILTESGKRKEALTYLERALSLNIELGDYEMVAEKYTDLGKILADENDFDFSLEFFEKALKIHKDLGKNEEMIKDYSNMGLVLVNKGEINRAVSYFEICLKLSEELNYLKWLESTLPTIFKSYGFLKKKDPGKTFYLRILDKFPELAKKL
ncbi:MAG: tetratricopeptide repeat protein [Candidatus Lokiarchaeia archaeon]